MRSLVVLLGCYFAGGAAAILTSRDLTADHFRAIRLDARGLKGKGNAGASSSKSKGDPGPSSSKIPVKPGAQIQAALPPERVNVKDLLQSSSSSSSSSGGSSASSSPSTSPKSSDGSQSPFSPVQKSIANHPLPRQPIGLPGNRSPTYKSLIKPKTPESRLPGTRSALTKQSYTQKSSPIDLDSLKAQMKALDKVANPRKPKTKAATTVVGPGRIEAMGNFAATSVKEIDRTKGATWSLKDKDMVTMGGSVSGGHIRAKGRGDSVAVKLDTGPVGIGYYQDLRDPEKKRVSVGPGKRIEKDFHGLDGQSAKVKVGMDGHGSAHVSAMNRPPENPAHQRQSPIE